MIPPHFNVVVVAVVVFNLLLLMLLISILAQTFLGVVVCFYDVTVSCRDSPFYPFSSLFTLYLYIPLFSSVFIFFILPKVLPLFYFTGTRAGLGSFWVHPTTACPHLHPRFCYFLLHRDEL